MIASKFIDTEKIKQNEKAEKLLSTEKQEKTPDKNYIK